MVSVVVTACGWVLAHSFSEHPPDMAQDASTRHDRNSQLAYSTAEVPPNQSQTQSQKWMKHDFSYAEPMRLKPSATTWPALLLLHFAFSLDCDRPGKVSLPALPGRPGAKLPLAHAAIPIPSTVQLAASTLGHVVSRVVGTEARMC